eukprot:9501020-Lingulodinium_polyedra.AAC.1
MGWTRALYWCQRVHERLLSDLEGFEEERRIVDRRPTGELGTGRFTIYVDNLLVFADRAAT